MGFMHEFLNAKGIYSESDVKKLRRHNAALWESLVSLKCATMVRSESIQKEIDYFRRDVITKEEFLRNVHNDCMDLDREVAVAQYMIDVGKEEPYLKH